MLLRPRQGSFVERCVRALREHHNTLGIAPTGAGKTIMLSHIIKEMKTSIGGRRTLVLAHRAEILEQNVLKFARVAPQLKTSIYNASSKSWGGDVVFAMEPTLRRRENLLTMPDVGLLVIDEAHHIVAPGYRRIIDHAESLNPDIMILGVTATPSRSDQKNLGRVFTNAADQITLAELIASGHLVPPRTFVIDEFGISEQLDQVRQIGGEFDMNAVAEIMDRRPVTEAVIDHWQAKAGDRQTVVFCSTIVHATHVQQAFETRGVEAVLVHGKLAAADRRARLGRFQKGYARVAVNVGVLIEGWDHPPTSCIVLLRPFSCKSATVQMIGRGLRIVAPAEFPGIVKTDCIVLDFGNSVRTHGCIEQQVDLTERQPRRGTAPMKPCPECGAMVHIAIMECPSCPYCWPEKPTEPIANFEMSEIDIVGGSRFHWTELCDGTASIALAGNAWIAMVLWQAEWSIVAGAEGQRPLLLGRGERSKALQAAEAWLADRGEENTARRLRAFRGEPPTPRQLERLGNAAAVNPPGNRYDAAARLAFQLHREDIKRLVGLMPGRAA
jgi:superfamily II DNA or RNA helicase